MRAVFDLDDTISVHNNRDYANATPIMPVVEKMRQMKKDGWEIIIYTARGQVSCNGDLAEIERRNRTTIETWIKKHDVPCDGIIFGKPIGDVYVDDKGMSLKSFLNSPFHYLKGGSGRTVYRMGDVVKKDLGDDVNNFKSWIEDSESLCKRPEIISYLYNQVTMEYIEGDLLCDVLTEEDLHALTGIIDKLKKKKKSGFDMDEHLSILEKNKSGERFDRILNYAKGKLRKAEKSLANNASFCHGDATLCNIIKAKDGLYFIDPSYSRKASSYLLDYGKLRMSLSNYEKRFGISARDNSAYRTSLDEVLKRKGVYDEVIALNLMYICRLYRYKKDKRTVEKMAEELIEEEYGGR